MPLKIVIVGGIAAGASAATKARRVNEQALIKVFEKGPYISFANCGLPYYISEEIRDRDDLFLQDPERFWKRFRVEAHVLHEVLEINPIGQEVTVRNLKTKESFVESYDKLILATGAGAIIPKLPGIRAENIFTVKTVPDSDRIKEFIIKYRPKKAVVVGAGFIGLEIAEALNRRGLEVSIVEKLNQVLPVFDPDVSQFVSRHLENNGIKLILSDGIAGFSGEPFAREVQLESGKKVPLDMAILSIGVRPELELARRAGLTIGAAGGIVVDESQQTSDPDIYAAGDAVELTHLVTGRKTRLPLAGPANRQGRVAGANAAGDNLTFPGALGTAIVESMGITAAKTGLSEQEAWKEGFSPYISFTHSMDHANYYPGGSLLHIKLIADQENGRVLGAQIVGEKGVDKRIDVLATALSARLKVTDLENLDLAYAPQFSTAKDPVIMAGFVASNILRTDFQSITCDELRQRLEKGEPIQVVDVRSKKEYQRGDRFPQSVLIPLDELRDRVGELDRDRDTVVYCQSGLRSYLAARILQQNGFKNVLNLSGGLLVCGQPQTAVAASAGQSSISVEAFQPLLEKNTGSVFDVREQDEFKYEHIAGTANLPLSLLETLLMDKPKEKEVYLVCQTGVRTKQALEVMQVKGFSRVHAVEGGIEAWKKAGYPVKREKGPIPVMRQVQIVAGSLVLIGGLVPGLTWVALFVGAGLVFAGISGWCGMAKLLLRMPWNKTSSDTVPSGCNSSGCN